MTIGNLSMRLQQLGPALHQRRDDAGAAAIHTPISWRISVATMATASNLGEACHG